MRTGKSGWRISVASSQAANPAPTTANPTIFRIGRLPSPVVGAANLGNERRLAGVATSALEFRTSGVRGGIAGGVAAAMAGSAGRVDTPVASELSV